MFAIVEFIEDQQGPPGHERSQKKQWEHGRPIQVRIQMEYKAASWSKFACEGRKRFFKPAFYECDSHIVVLRQSPADVEMAFPLSVAPALRQTFERIEA